MGQCGGGAVWSRGTGWVSGGGDGCRVGAESQGWEPEEPARSGASTFSPELQHLPLMKHFITTALRGAGGWGGERGGGTQFGMINSPRRPCACSQQP